MERENSVSLKQSCACVPVHPKTQDPTQNHMQHRRDATTHDSYADPQRSETYTKGTGGRYIYNATKVINDMHIIPEGRQTKKKNSEQEGEGEGERERDRDRKREREREIKKTGRERIQT